mgnify:CR=1 FL=1
MRGATKKAETKSESKYVSCFADSKPDVDITFRDVLLTRPADHYLVGIDNFSLTNSTLSMIEPHISGDYETFFRIVRNLGNTVADHPDIALANAADYEAIFFGNGERLRASLDVARGYDLSIKSTEKILNMQHLMVRFAEVAADVNEFMNTNQAARHVDVPGGDGDMFEFLGYHNDNGSNDRVHLKFEITADGRFKITGTRAFWSCFSIEIPSIQNQFGLYGARTAGDVVDFTRLRRYLSVHPETGAIRFDKIGVNTERQPGSERHLTGTEPHVLFRTTTLTGATGLFNKASGATASETISISCRACIYSTLERRVALEVGCSLPIKNSPMIDHEKESPDFVLGRWIWRTDPRLESSNTGGSQRFHGDLPACTEYQGAQDRITYHELQAQSKVQTLRLKLFARVRQFDEALEIWTMRVIALPTASTDWWHMRVHFVSKD